MKKAKRSHYASTLLLSLTAFCLGSATLMTTPAVAASENEGRREAVVFTQGVPFMPDDAAPIVMPDNSTGRLAKIVSED